MSEIPDDIMKTAAEAFYSANMDGADRQIVTIANAIHAERKRCAEICDFYAEKYGRRSEVREDAANEIRGFIQGILIRGEA
jgi:hypothetical protein